ncbi:cytochrome d1 heme region NirN [Pseudogulbenkiania sp. NH8B]|uniref:nitrite reductase n=1 Tax=Pseudogulbenkiania sp. (strain NH8B) TaxID=748280 RepID=UPI000227992E|nr:nitrite reductase [Pseudogulbenkiania sp. NH8B]BAK76253.1 cytochrome d1 heme region NirN [Pseudogulbenkiania sp. NH8B]
MKALLPLALLAALGSLQPASANPAALYQQHCQSCHGDNRMGAMAPALLPQSLERLKPAEILDTIRHGRSATQMPAFAERLADADIQALAGYLKTAPEQPARWSDADTAASRVVYADPARLPAKPVHRADPQNLFVVVEAGDHHVSVLDGDTLSPIARFQSRFALHGGPKFSPDGRFVYFASRDGWVTQYDLYTLQNVAEIRVGLNTRNVAVSSDGRWVLAGNTLPETLVLLDANGLKPVKTLAVQDAAGKTSRVSAVYDAAPRHSFIVALKDVPELWEISYDPKAARVYPGHVHDYKMGEALSVDGFLNPRVTPLDLVLDDFFFDPAYRHVIGASREGRAQVINLDIRRKVAELPLDGMPHLGSGIAFEEGGHRYMATPNLSSGRVTVIDLDSWQRVKDIPTLGPGFFLRSHENTPYAWVDAMMGAKKDTLAIIDKRTLEVVKTVTPRPGKTTAHVEFTRDGRYALVSVMENPGELLVLDAATFREVKSLPMAKPIGKYNVFNKVTRSEGTSH